MHFGCDITIIYLTISILIFIEFNNHKLSAQDPSKSSSNIICSLSQNCSRCISNPSCAWCSSNTIIAGASRCDSYDNLLSIGCPEPDIMNPTSSIETVENKVQVKDSESPILLHPQKFVLHTRQNEVQRLTITYEQPFNYPIDLYYLMDLTHSMKDHKDKLVELADSLAEKMNNITKIFRLGFGSFIDKVVMPYANMAPMWQENPCPDKIECAPPYGFRNHLPLNDNITQFGQKVSSTPLSGNLDNAEGGFDAIMQVLRCRDHIKWNNISRKIILFATDSFFHYAGDGKLGGIVKPNDGECHLNEEGYYTESIFQDYPSLEQINRVVTDSKINMIFAVPEDIINVYKKLSEHIPGSTYGVLKDDSSNIVDLIRGEYERISQRVELRDNSSDAVQIKYISRCLGSYKSETHICDNITKGERVEFDVEIVVTECPPNGRQRIQITPIGINEYTIVDLNVMCECKCESESMSKPNSTDCFNFGTQACGVCQCNSNRFGKNCECSGDDAIRQDKLDQCKRNTSGTVLCSNRGNCVCGQCQCHSKQNFGDIISGDYCECDTFSCGRDVSGLSCGGPQKGRCCDSECRCADGWSGPICECSTSNSTCLSTEESDKLCSGHGDCRCGKCRCNEGYYGEYCQDCASCEGQCNELQLCVECKVFKGGIYSPLECRDKCAFEYEVSQSLEYLENARECIFVDREGCRISFDYNYREGNQMLIRVLEERECAEVFNAYVAVGSISLIVFLIGLIALLIFRLFIWYKDKQEFERFIAEVEKTKPHLALTEENPIFKSAQTKHINPMYGSGRS